MHLPAKRWKKMAALALLLAALASPVWPDIQPAPTNAETRKLCYCGCDFKPGSPMCLHMCELAKYQNRWWARTCRKVENLLPAIAWPQQNGRSRARNTVQDARK